MADVYKKMSVGAYSKLRGLQQQLVHYYIRKGDIQTETCTCCGCKVIDVEKADAVLKVKGK